MKKQYQEDKFDPQPAMPYQGFRKEYKVPTDSEGDAADIDEGVVGGVKPQKYDRRTRDQQTRDEYRNKIF